MSDARLGTTLGSFEILDVLGRGGMGVVYEARDRRLGRSVALKIMPEAVVGDAQRRRRFLREARTAAAINHPNVAIVYEVGEEGPNLFIAMERVSGMTLRTLLLSE